MAPVKSSRVLVKIDEITRTKKTGNNTTQEPIIVKIKESFADYFGLTPVESDDPQFTGTFGGDGPNKGKKYLRRLGGFKEASYTFIAKATFDVNDIEVGDNGERKTTSHKVKTLSIGFPRGHSALEVITWARTLDNADKIRAIRMPSGAAFPL